MLRTSTSGRGPGKPKRTLAVWSKSQTAALPNGHQRLAGLEPGQVADDMSRSHVSAIKSRVVSASELCSNRPSAEFNTFSTQEKPGLMVAVPRAPPASVAPCKPAQDSQGTECVPAARRSSRTFHVEVDLALMGLSERPSPVLVSTPCHQVDGFVGPFIGLHAGPAQVVQAPQDVVMPTSRKRESCPTRSMIFSVASDDLAG